MIGYGSSPSRCGPAHTAAGQTTDLRFPHKERPYVPESPTTPGRWNARARASLRIALRVLNRVGTQDRKSYRGSMAAGPHAPLPTLRRHPHGCPRTARGRCGSRILHRSGLAPLAPCRSPGALNTDFGRSKLSGHFCPNHAFSASPRPVSRVPKHPPELSSPQTATPELGAKC